MSRKAILELNYQQRLGLNGLAAGGNRQAFGKGTQTWGRHMLRIPEADFAVLKVLNPGMASHDPAEFSAAMLAFERSDASIPYRVIEDVLHGSRPVIYDGGSRNQQG